MSHTPGTTVERISHRGAKRELPENSLPAFARAFERCADAIELDAHATADGVVVVHHDPALGRTAGSLQGRRIAELCWEDVATVELGAGIGIPTLASVLQATPASATVYVEIKADDIEHQVAEVIRCSTTRCVVHSFNHETIARMQMVAPEIPRGILFDHALPDVAAAMQAVGARDTWPASRLIDATLVRRVHEAGGRVIAWTVNSRTSAQALIALGVDGLCTDDVRILDGL